jgi:hypothetical protein
MVTVSVVVLVPFAVTLVGLATRLELVVFGVPATNVTVVVSLNPPMVAVMVLACATVDVMVAVNTPDALVVPLTGLTVLPEPLLARLTACPLTALPWASSTVTVKVVVLVPFAVTELGLAVTDDVALAAGPATKVTPAVSLIAPMVAVTVFACAVVELNVAVNTPDALVVPLTGVNVLFNPVLARLTA